MLDLYKDLSYQATLKAPVLVRSPKLSINKPSQYVDERSFGKRKYYKQFEDFAAD